MQVYAALHWAILPVVEIVYDFILHGIPEYSRYVPGVLRFFEMVANLHRYHLLAYSARSKRLLSCNHLGKIGEDDNGRHIRKKQRQILYQPLSFLRFTYINIH